MSDYESHITFGEGIAGTPMEYWLREHTTAKMHGPDDPIPADDPVMQALADGQVQGRGV
jgi:hypothetical protein